MKSGPFPTASASIKSKCAAGPVGRAPPRASPGASLPSWRRKFRLRDLDRSKIGPSRTGNHPLQSDSSVPLASFLDRSVFPELGARSTLKFFVQSFYHNLGQEFIASIPRSAFAARNGRTVAPIARAVVSRLIANSRLESQLSKRRGVAWPKIRQYPAQLKKL